VNVTLGEPYVDPEIPRPSMGGPLQVRLPGVRSRVRAAAEVLWPPLYVEAVRPFWRRLLYAGEAMRLPSSVTFSQRVRYGIGRGFGEGVNREVPGNVPQVFSDMFVFWRRLRRSYRAFRRFRGVGIPPVGLYENETTTRMRIETARNRTEAIRRRRQGRGRWS
jgi:hypothetical protein